MLEATLTTTFLPGTNLKGGTAGGNWTYVLPSLELGQVVVIGRPAAATLATLSRCANRVWIVCDSDRQVAAARQAVSQRGLDNVTPLDPASDPCQHILAASTDLIVVSPQRASSRWGSFRQAGKQWKRWLKPEGNLYFQESALAYWLLHRGNQGLREIGDVQLLWLTPQFGESHTFVAAEDHETVQYFHVRGLESESFRSTALKQFAGSGGRNRKDDMETRSPDIAATARGPKRLLRGIRTLVRRSVRAAMAGCNRCESILNRPGALGNGFGRRGVIVGPHAAQLGASPPKYLCAIAQQCGVSIEGYRWGLSASGDYDSRKLVFFLFQRKQPLPQFVVKMTRSASFNRRLDQERQALELLEEKGLGDLETLPRIAFAGTHGGLAIVGETAIDGVPFDRRTTATANCPYARAAMEWLTELGSITASTLSAAPSEVAFGLRRLLTRFTELYPISTSEHAFLNAQISLLEFNQLPVVFQHGDPGRWNVFVTPRGRICFLDWEAAEPNGMPLWDLLYFLRSFCVRVAQAKHRNDRLRSLDDLLLENSPLGELAVDAVTHYCAETGLAGNLVEPLFYTCWMHRALKESTRLSPSSLRDGHYFNFLRLCIDRRESPTLRRLFTSS